ncbi:MAG: CRTAC1 family protein [Acidobacteriota bacterium]
MRFKDSRVTRCRLPRLPLLGLFGVVVAATLTLPATAAASAGDGWTFVDVTAASGIAHSYLYDPTVKPIEPKWICGGVAAGDADGDGWIDLYLVGGELGANALYRNRGDGGFDDVTVAAGVAVEGVLGCGPSFVDLEGDGDDDLVVLTVAGAPRHQGQPAVQRPEAVPKVFCNRGDGSFDPPTDGGFTTYDPTYSAAFGDVDGDGDLDAVTTSWRYPSLSMIWSNDGAGLMADATAASLVGGLLDMPPYSFTPNLVDLEGDGDLDLLIAGDFGGSRVLEGQGDGTFVDVTGPEITDENGMGATVGDIDNDGDPDWLVTSIWDPDGDSTGGNWGITGNRLYRNRGDGRFDDVTDAAGVREGYWGWGACFADFDNDGDLDLFHVNGFPAAGASEFHADPSRLFLNRGDGTFVESSAAVGFDDVGQGRGVVCFDYDRDGDLDVFVAQNAEPSRLYRNDLPAGSHWLQVRLAGEAPNPAGIGARIEVETGGVTQTRWLQAGSHFVSQNPVEAHFGLGDAATVERLRVTWPDGRACVRLQVPADQYLVMSRGEIFADSFESGTLAGWSLGHAVP